MARMNIRGLVHRYGKHAALDHIDLDVASGEILAVVGPSGCGKSTLLRAIAGLEKPESGLISMDGQILSDGHQFVPAERRRIGMVFQSYALWPHLSVQDNVAFGLKVQGIAAADCARRALDALDMVGLREFAQRKPAALSGGQRQRVALARCLVMEPGVVLFDEPLANLDVHLRAALQREFLKFHRRTGTTFIYVTHDQAEAMAMADRIAVLSAGKLLQVDTPVELYNRPASREVAEFIGESCWVEGTVLGHADQGAVRMEVLGAETLCAAAFTPQTGSRHEVCLRPGRIRVLPPGQGISAVVEEMHYLGGHHRLTLQAGDATLVAYENEGGPLRQPGEAVGVRIESGWIVA